MGIDKFLTHPVTGETRSQNEWCAVLGITKKALRYRLIKQVPLEEALTIKTPIWTQEEDELLIEVYDMPNLYEFWVDYCQNFGWNKRTKAAVDKRIEILKTRGIISKYSHDTNSSWLVLNRLAFLLATSHPTVTRWVQTKSLTAYKDGTRIWKISVQDFVAWGLTEGVEELAGIFKSNPAAAKWFLSQVGKFKGDLAEKKIQSLENQINPLLQSQSNYQIIIESLISKTQLLEEENLKLKTQNDLYEKMLGDRTERRKMVREVADSCPNSLQEIQALRILIISGIEECVRYLRSLGGLRA